MFNVLANQLTHKKRIKTLAKWYVTEKYKVVSENELPL